MSLTGNLKWDVCRVMEVTGLGNVHRGNAARKCGG